MSRAKELHGIEIVKVADKGLGMGYHEGKVIFVERSVPGDVVDVRTYKNKKNFSMAYPLEFQKLSEQRITPFCRHFGTCGGCKWQNLPYSVQLEHKQQLVGDALQRIMGITGVEVEPVIPADPERFYRNKLEYTFSNRKWLTLEEMESEEELPRDGLGFHIPRQFDKVLDVFECFLQPAPSDAIRNFVREFVLKHQIPFFDLKAQTGVLRNLIIRNNLKSEFLIILAITEKFEQLEMLMQELTAKFPQITSMNYVINTKGNSTINDLEIQNYSGQNHLIEELGSIKYRIGPKSFFQTNATQAEVLYDLVRKHADINKEDLVYDLYTGLGSIALYVADLCKRLVGIEWVEDSVADAKVNAKLN
ncbi:MAG: 23S rRNA (uracil1939-C5)-methyltransferase, partial [Limisphaerales bacterium]